MKTQVELAEKALEIFKGFEGYRYCEIKQVLNQCEHLVSACTYIDLGTNPEMNQKYYDHLIREAKESDRWSGVVPRKRD